MVSGKTGPLLANAHPIDSKSQIAPAAGATFQVERTSFAGSPIRVERVCIGIFVVLVARKIAPTAQAEHLATAFDAFAAWRTICVVGACNSP